MKIYSLQKFEIQIILYERSDVKKVLMEKWKSFALLILRNINYQIGKISLSKKRVLFIVLSIIVLIIAVKALDLSNCNH